MKKIVLITLLLYTKLVVAQTVSIYSVGFSTAGEKAAYDAAFGAANVTYTTGGEITNFAGYQVVIVNSIDNNGYSLGFTNAIIAFVQAGGHAVLCTEGGTISGGGQFMSTIWNSVTGDAITETPGWASGTTDPPRFHNSLGPWHLSPDPTLKSSTGSYASFANLNPLNVTHQRDLNLPTCSLIEALSAAYPSRPAMGNGTLYIQGEVQYPFMNFGNSPEVVAHAAAIAKMHYALIANDNALLTTLNTWTANLVVLTGFLGADISLCDNGTAQTISCNTSFASYLWNDASASTTQAISVNTTGQYIVKTTGTFPQCDGEDTIMVALNSVPVLDFTATTECLKKPTAFTNNSTSSIGIKKWKWTFGTTNLADTSGVKDPNFKYTNCNQTYNVTLEATNDSGCAAIPVTKPVNVLCLPTPNFTANNGCEKNDVIQFNNTSTNGASATGLLSYNWLLDPSTSTATNTTKNYTVTGIKNVALIVTDANNCTDTLQKTLQIYPTPQANFVVDSVCLNIANAFTNTSTLTVPAGFTDAINNYVWTYNFDGSNYTSDATTQHTTHGYTLTDTQATPIAALIVKTNNGCADTIVQPVIVWSLPKANYTMTAPCFPNPILFTNASSIAAGTDNSTMASMVINWGNGQKQAVTGINQTLNYNHNTSGNYASKLVVTSNHGCADSANVNITIHAKPVANYTLTNHKGCTPLCVNFIDASTQNDAPVTETIAAYNWNFGDYNATKPSDNKSTKTNPTHCYNNTSDSTQLHSVQLIITTTAGCTDTLLWKDSVEMYPMPTANFKLSETAINLLNPELIITDQSHLANTVTWDYNNGDISYAINATPLLPMAEYVYLYQDSGSYIIKQLVKTNKGCADSISHPVRINPITTLFIPNAFSPDGDGLNDCFMVRGVNMKTLEITIYNRYGTVIARINDVSSKGWDGTDLREGKLSQQEVYNWKMEYTDVFDIKHKGLVGSVTLLK